MKFKARPSVLFVLVLACSLALAPSPARASTETLRRSIQNIVLAPFDLLLAPVVAGHTLWQNLRDSEDTTAVKVAYPLPGYVWLTGVQAGASVLREVAGLIELLPGIGLSFFETDMEPLYELPDKNDALIDQEIPGFAIRIGVDYTTASSF